MSYKLDGDIIFSVTLIDDFKLMTIMGYWWQKLDDNF